MCPFFQYLLRQYIWFYKPEVKQVNVILELTILMPLVTWGQHTYVQYNNKRSIALNTR